MKLSFRLMRVALYHWWRHFAVKNSAQKQRQAKMRHLFIILIFHPVSFRPLGSQNQRVILNCIFLPERMTCEQARPQIINQTSRSAGRKNSLPLSPSSSANFHFLKQLPGCHYSPQPRDQGKYIKMAILASSQTSLLTPRYILIVHSISPLIFTLTSHKYSNVTGLFSDIFVLVYTLCRELVDKKDICTCFNSVMPLNLTLKMAVRWVVYS